MRTLTAFIILPAETTTPVRLKGGWAGIVSRGGIVLAEEAESGLWGAASVLVWFGADRVQMPAVAIRWKETNGRVRVGVDKGYGYVQRRSIRSSLVDCLWSYVFLL